MTNTKLLFYLLTLVLCSLSACKSARSASKSTIRTSKNRLNKDGIVKSDNLKDLRSLMTGTFRSDKQAAEDSTYYDITLHMYPIWTAGNDTYLYVEQALSSDAMKPYRQRIYKLEKDGNGGFMSHVYTLDNAEAAVGQWKTPTYFDQYDQRILKEKEGCTVYLTRHGDGSYSGSTRMDHCKSTMRGASYATSIVKIRSGSVMSWDQGFDADGKQVWGAEQGGYRFVKITE